MYQREYEITQISPSGSHLAKFTAAVEVTVELYVNNILIASILASPGQLEQLAAGYLICEGVVPRLADIRNIRKDAGNRIFVDIARNEHFDLWFEIRSSGCIGVNWKEHEDLKVSSTARFSPDVICRSLHLLESDTYRLTRGTHAACIIDKTGDCIARAVDVGRHNAVDKAVGQALMAGFCPDEHFILSTGRQPAGMVLKAARAGIPLVVTKTAPLDSGIEAARRTGICLAGFAHEDNITVFSNKWRLDVKAENTI